MKVVSKGYTITVVSWENDGDNYNTNSLVLEDKDRAFAIAKMAKELFKSGSNSGEGIGNTNEGDESKANKKILSYLENNPNTFTNQDVMDEDELIGICMGYNYRLLGGSEWYYSRVLEKITLTYSETDINVEEIKF